MEIVAHRPSGVFNEGSPPRERLIIEVVPSPRTFLTRFSSPSTGWPGSQSRQCLMLEECMLWVAVRRGGFAERKAIWSCLGRRRRGLV